MPLKTWNSRGGPSLPDPAPDCRAVPCWAGLSAIAISGLPARRCDGRAFDPLVWPDGDGGDGPQRQLLVDQSLQVRRDGRAGQRPDAHAVAAVVGDVVDPALL